MKISAVCAARTPSTTYCTASAASRTPSSREAILAATPTRLAICAASTKTTKQSTRTTAITAGKIASSMVSPSLGLASRMVAVIAPGPAINGMASGKATILRTRSWNRLLGLLRQVPGAPAEHHFGCDREQQVIRRRCGRRANRSGACGTANRPPARSRQGLLPRSASRAAPRCAARVAASHA